jgi:spore coat protein CotF
MNDQLLMDNYLMVLKSTIEVYIHGTLESSNEDVRKALKQGLDETIKHQSRTYDEMTNYGWYKIENVNSQTINKAYKKVCNK